MIDKVLHIGPALYVQGGISSVLVSYKKLFGLPDKNFLASYNGSFVKSLPMFLCVCLRLLLCPPKDFDFFQIHTSYNGSFFRKFLISLCLRIRKRKYIAHIHGSQFKRMCYVAPKAVKFLIRSYFRHSSMVVCITPDMRDFLDEFVGKGLCCYEVIPNPCQTIADEPIKYESHEFPVKIAFSGRYGHRKGVYDLIKAFSQAKFSVPAEMYLFGDGEVEEVKAAAAASAKPDSIHVSGWLKHDDYLKRLPEYDLLALPSYAETFGMSLVEAMGVGLPVVSTMSGGVPFVVRDGCDGFLVEAGDIDALSEKLARLVDDDALRSHMGIAAWKGVTERFSGRVVLNALEHMYSKMG